jgi:hypothetical protein
VNGLALCNVRIAVHHVDLRHATDIDALAGSDWLIDAAVNRSVLAGVSGVTSSRVLAGAGQFGRPDQGTFSYWIYAWLRNRPLKYIGFNRKGYQVRD